MNTPTPRTDKVVASDMGDSGFIVDLIKHGQQLEQELNEARLWIEKSNTVQYVMQVESERDQLRKVVDAIHEETRSMVNYCDGDIMYCVTDIRFLKAICMENIKRIEQLPHVLERKTK